MKTALVTGARGFTGRYLVPALRSRQYRVIGLVEDGTASADTVVCDLTDPQAVSRAVQSARPDVVVHLAAVSFVGHGYAEEFYRVNVLGTENLLSALAKLDAPPSCVVVASSANVYGTPNLDLIDETVCPAPINHYGFSKIAMEYMAKTWFDRLPIVITRPFNYTGPGQDERFVIPKIVGHFHRRAPLIELGNLDVSRDFSDVRDVAAAYVALLEGGVSSEVVNICSGKTISLREVISTLHSLAGYEIDVRVNRDLVRENDIRRLAGSNEKLRRLIGFVPAIPMSETLRRMYERVSKEGC